MLNPRINDTSVADCSLGTVEMPTNASSTALWATTDIYKYSISLPFLCVLLTRKNMLRMFYVTVRKLTYLNHIYFWLIFLCSIFTFVNVNLKTMGVLHKIDKYCKRRYNWISKYQAKMLSSWRSTFFLNIKNSFNLDHCQKVQHMVIISPSVVKKK